MIKFSKEKVLLLHRLIAEETGGSIGVRYETLLESALENVFSGFGGQEFYPTREEKGARLLRATFWTGRSMRSTPRTSPTASAPPSETRTPCGTTAAPPPTC